MKELSELITKEEVGINKELFQKNFNFQMPTAMLKSIFRAKDKKKSDDLVKLIKSELKDLKEETEDMSENEIKTEEPNKLVDIVERILEFNRQEEKWQGLVMSRRRFRMNPHSIVA